MTNIVIRGDLAKLNEHDKANRINRYVGAALKKRMTDLVAKQCVGIKPFTVPVKIGFHWFYSGKHDFDNHRFSAKYCLDGLVHAGVLPDDNQTWVREFTGDLFYKTDKGQEKVIIEIEPY